jgi:flavin reductase (DIM6/NTAB) family NADH-FMN oxidoreductase RutF
MTKQEKKLFDGIYALPAFPLVLVTAGRNVMTAAAFSFYSFDPPCVMVGLRPATLTYELVSEIGEFGINIPTTEHLDIVRICGSVSGRVEDKFARTGLSPQKGQVIDSVLVAECPVSLECKAVHRVQYGGSHVWFIGEIQAVHIDQQYTRDQALMYWLSEYRKVGEILFKVDRK